MFDFNGKREAVDKAASIENEQDVPYTFVLRSELVRILSAALAAGTIVYQKKLIHFKQDGDHVRLAFEDGTCAETDYMIASDGIFSTIRETLLPGHSVRFAGYACWRGIVRHCPAHIAKRFTETWGPKGRFGIVPLAQDRIYWYALKNCHEHNEELRYWSKEDLCYHFIDYHEPIPVLLDKTEQVDIFYRNIYDLPPIKQFAFQRILLIGDAAHATTPNMAQGACQALEDALILALCFDRQQEIRQAFLEYEKIRMDRTRKVVKDSWMIGKVAQLEAPLLCTLRNKMIELAPDSIHTKKLKDLFSVQTS